MLRVILCAALVLAGVLGDETSSVIPPPHPPQPTAVPHNTTTTTTTAAPTTSTTPKPTPTPPPSTTTVGPTPAPTPTPDNKPGIWNVTEANTNKTVACVVATMYVNIVVPYMKVDHKTNTTLNATANIVVPSNAIASGTCGNESQSLTLSWKVPNASLTVTFAFEKNNKSEFTLASVQASIPAREALFPDIAVNTTDFKLNSMNASAPIPVHQSYLCMAGVNFTLADSTHKNATPVVPTLILKHVQFQAFANVKENKFDTALDCAAVPYVTPDIVPIAVGVSLAALVAVVLVAYVIGRRRSAARGYLSM